MNDHFDVRTDCEVPVATVSDSDAQPSFLRVTGGYIAAVLIASAIVLVAFGTPTDGYLKAFRFVFLGCALTFGFGLPGFIVTIVLARVLHLRQWPFFIIAGGLDGFVALYLLLRQPPPFDFCLMVVPGGMAGGLAYWLVAYHRRIATT
ncbi:hypothetical protein [Shinella sp.]|uniref:hypothetical protein n=1 Tax=Shinella sp. TaxID=1870904 RepID=UPI003D2C2914